MTLPMLSRPFKLLLTALAATCTAAVQAVYLWIQRDPGGDASQVSVDTGEGWGKRYRRARHTATLSFEVR